MSGWTVPGYVVEGLLGLGGSGDVWRARVASTGESVALKRVMLGASSRARNVHLEAAVLRTLDHPHLIRLHEVVPTADAVVLVLDLAAGGSLVELVAARGSITAGEAITALAPVGAALAYAHNAGVVHGDVTPANVLFTETGMPMLADLGVARLLGEDAPVHSTPAFIDPAVAAGCVPGPQSDVFMLGAVTLHALTGRPLWPGDTPAEALAAAAAGQAPDIDAMLAAADVPLAIRHVVSRALSIEPAQRGSAAEFALDLRHAGTPLVVELSARRRRVLPAPPVSAAVPSAQPARPDPGAAANPRAAEHPARPPFDRPRAGAATPQPAVLTHAVRSRPRPLAPPRSHGVLPASVPARCAAALGVLGLLAVLAWTAVGHRGASGGAVGASSAPRVARPADPMPPARSGRSATDPPRTSTSGRQPAGLDARGVRIVLAQLDRLRQRAFAERDAGLLGKVYAPGPLLIQDSALLERLVPAGCRLQGVHTSYEQVRVTVRSATRAQAAVRATLSESVLVCAAEPPRRAQSAGPSRLVITLERHGSSYRIAGIER